MLSPATAGWDSGCTVVIIQRVSANEEQSRKRLSSRGPVLIISAGLFLNQYRLTEAQLLHACELSFSICTHEPDHFIGVKKFLRQILDLFYGHTFDDPFTSLHVIMFPAVFADNFKHVQLG